MAERTYLGTLPQRVALQKLAIKFRQEGSQVDFDALKDAVDGFEELATAPPKPDPTPEPEQPELPGDDAGSSEDSDSTSA